MHTAESTTVAAERVDDLHKSGFKPCLREFIFAEKAREEAALVLPLF
jgi:hypothetical protein